MARLRSPSLFWTFAGGFLAALLVAAALQVVVVGAVVRPLLGATRVGDAERAAAASPSVAEAVQQSRPYAVDISSGVESSPGIKDKALMKAFISEVKKAYEY